MLNGWNRDISLIGHIAKDVCYLIPRERFMRAVIVWRMLL